ncbi:MAG TPA: hypothetical protein VNW98_00300 [Burkholderiaceae bacterium]|nr:hypothetical protein [Burkholderiaceae bacterium]
MALFRVLLAVFGVAVLFFATRFILTGQRRYLRWTLWVLAVALGSGVLFFAVLLVSRLA